MKRMLGLIPLLVPAMVRADGIIGITDGGTYNVNSPTQASYDLWNGTLNVLPGAGILAITMVDPPTSVRVTGGTVHVIDVDAGSLNVSGGYFSSSDYALSVMNGTANITGGTFIGAFANDPLDPGRLSNAVVGSSGDYNGTPYLSVLNISGGTFQGGFGSAGGMGYSVLSLGDTTITGGRFLTPVDIVTAHGGHADFLGTNLTYSNHILSGVLQNGDPIHVLIDTDSANVVVNASGTEVSFNPSAPGPVGTVPEPTSALVFGLLGGAFGLALRRRHREVAC